MDRYIVSVTRKDHKVLDRYALGSLASRLAQDPDGDPLNVGTLRVSQHGPGTYRVDYDQTFRMVTDAASPIQALRTFLHMSDLPDDLDHTRIVVRLEEPPAPATADFIPFAKDNRAMPAPLLPKHTS